MLGSEGLHKGQLPLQEKGGQTGRTVSMGQIWEKAVLLMGRRACARQAVPRGQSTGIWSLPW